MELWIVVDSRSGYEPEPFTNRNDAVANALEILKDYQEQWQFEDVEYQEACAEISEAGYDLGRCWSTYLGECEVTIYKKFI